MLAIVEWAPTVEAQVLSDQVLPPCLPCQTALAKGVTNKIKYSPANVPVAASLGSGVVLRYRQLGAAVQLDRRPLNREVGPRRQRRPAKSHRRFEPESWCTDRRARYDGRC